MRPSCNAGKGERKHTSPPPKAMISTHMAIPLGSNTCKFCPACDLTWPLRSKWLHQSTFCATTMEASTWNSFSILACTCILCVQPIYHKEMQLLVEQDCLLPKYVVSWRRITAHKVLEILQKWTTGWDIGESLDKVQDGCLGLTVFKVRHDCNLLLMIYASYLLLLGT